ncbi:MAG: ATP cone domain-containing protein [Halioglobus sp.]|jgi:ribonucleoside-diphosphate reductase alpha chain|tara:strand:- start:506 stop:1708 length:1203 start_codon:yes stop_codon:yes gene_type:complete
MQTESSSAPASSAAANPNPAAAAPTAQAPVTEADIAATAPGGYRVIRRNGKVTPFDASKIEVALTKAFLAVEGSGAAASGRIHETVKELTSQIDHALTRHLSGGGTVHIEDIQDQVELGLMRNGHHKVARDYVLYREQRAQERAAEAEAAAKKTRRGRKKAAAEAAINVTLADGSTQPLDEARMRRLINEACDGLTDVDAERIISDSLRNLYDGITEKELAQAVTLCARALIEAEPNYSTVSARLLLDTLRHEALGFLDASTDTVIQAEMAKLYPQYLKDYITKGIELELLDPELGQYDLARLGKALLPERDMQFTYLGLQTLYDRYFLHSNNVRFELPQAFFMRVAMGLAINEVDREDRAIEFYTLLSSFDFMSSTPTLFNSGTLRPQLSSCYLTTVQV